MREFSFRSVTFSILTVFLLWSANFEGCTARRGKHWRPGKATSASLSKKKGYHSRYGGGSNTKPPSPSHKTTSPPSPKPVEPPAPSPPHQPAEPPALPPPQMVHNGGNAAPTLNVFDFGAKGDGETDDTKAFEGAWTEACKMERSTIVVPRDHVFLVGPISFSGPYCQPNLVFQLDGTMIAPTEAEPWSGGPLQWLHFTKLKGITVQGKGLLDGRGSVWWQHSPYHDAVDEETRLIVPLNSTLQEQPPFPMRSEAMGKMASVKPAALRFYGSFNVTVTGITIQNSPQCHLKFDNCVGVRVHDVSVTAPADSLNTDGIHLQNSKDVLIHNTSLSCGDDCISIQTGCSDVSIHNVNCGPGHGISIGSLGRDNTKACVSNITVRGAIMNKTLNGVRIKTWQGGLGSVQGVVFSDIQVYEVQMPIVIDQFYCDKGNCRNESAAVALSGINYERIRGTYTVKAVHFACSDSQPCVDVSLTAIELTPLQEQHRMYNNSAFCWQTFGELKTPTLPPIDCLRIGKPSANRIQYDNDSC